MNVAVITPKKCMAFNPYKPPSSTTALNEKELTDGWCFRYVAPLAVTFFCFGVVVSIVSFGTASSGTDPFSFITSVALLLFGLLIPGRNVKIFASALIVACTFAACVFSGR